MKVHELISHLLTLDQNSDIVVDGYEGGVTEKFSVEVASVISNVYTQWYYGEHEIDDCEYLSEEYPESMYKRKSVVYISRFM